MKRSNGLVIALVLLGVAGIFIARLLLENFQLKVEVANLRSKQTTTAAQIARTPPPAAAAAAPSAAGARTVIESARQMMNDALLAEQGADRKAWIRVDPRDREASAFAGEIAAAFKDAGWDAKVLDNEGLRFKPGLLFLVGSEDDPPSYVLAAQKAVEAIGQEVTTGRGYQSYYDAKKRDTPDWQGTKFLPEQTFAILVGRKPDPKPAEAQ